jgi:hypothetical protein
VRHDHGSMGYYHVPFFFSAFAFSVILTWVYNSTGGAF